MLIGLIDFVDFTTYLCFMAIYIFPVLNDAMECVQWRWKEIHGKNDGFGLKRRVGIARCLMGKDNPFLDAGGGGDAGRQWTTDGGL